MSKFCCAPGCKTGSRNNDAPKRSLFKPPSDLERRQQWERLIPRKHFQLTKGVRICELHFDEKFIERNYVHIIQGEKTEIPRGHPRLTKDAIPTIFPNLPKYLSKKLPKSRTPPSQRVKRSNNNSPSTANGKNNSVEQKLVTTPVNTTDDSFRETNACLSSKKKITSPKHLDKTVPVNVIEPIITISVVANKSKDAVAEVEEKSNEEWSALLDARIMEICILKMNVRSLDKKLSVLREKCRVQAKIIQKLQRKQTCKKCTLDFTLEDDKKLLINTL